MNIRSVANSARAILSARILEKRYPLSRITPLNLAKSSQKDILLKPPAATGYIEACLQRRFANAYSGDLRKGIVYRECMLPGLKEGDAVFFVERQYLGDFFDPDYPERFDIVCFWNPRTSEGMVKRLIGLPLDHIEMRSGRILLNGRTVSEEYPVIGHLIDMERILIPKRHVFLLADNRARNEDSRSFGPIHISNIFGIVREVINL